MVLDPVTKRPYVAGMKCQPFGSRVSPRNWGRVVSFFKLTLRRLLNIIINCYVDDGFCAEPTASVMSAYRATIEIAELLGLSLAPEKLVEPCKSLSLLGAGISIKKSNILIKTPKEKSEQIKERIRNHQKKRRLTPADAATLRGKIGFTQQLAQGRYGKAMTVELSARQYCGTGRTKIGKELEKELSWW